MDEESKQLLREIRDLQKEQLALLRMWLPSPMRFRFSMRALLIALTIVALIFGLTVMLANIGHDAKRTRVTPAVPVTKK